MDVFRVSRSGWEEFLKRKSSNEILFAPFDVNDRLSYDRVTPENVSAVVYDRARPVEPFKLLLFPYQEKVSPVLGKFPTTAVLGLANCDLLGVEILDKVFAEGQYQDPHYGRRKEHTLAISLDCQNPYPTCFCEVLGNRPFAEKGFDLNITSLAGEFLIEVGTEKGRGFLGSLPGLRKAEEQHLKERKAVRETACSRVLEINKDYRLENIPERIKGLYEAERWKNIKDVSNCVQCGSCTANCPTCVCFLLEDTSSDILFKKMRIWDSCLYPGYARMAAGASPRPTLFDRYGNRLLCKYWHMVLNFGLKGCTGCGRCISGCIGKIDKRKVLDELLKTAVGAQSG
jgi:ferredoxin